MEWFRKWIDSPWRVMPFWARVVALLVAFYVASESATVLQHRLGSGLTFLVSAVPLIIIVAAASLIWRAMHISADD